MKQGSLYYLEHKIIIHPCSKAKAGFWIANEPYITLERNAFLSQQRLPFSLVQLAGTLCQQYSPLPS